MDIHLGPRWWIFDPNPALRVQVRTASEFVYGLFASAGKGADGGGSGDKTRGGKGKGNDKSSRGTRQKSRAKWKPAVNGNTPGFKPLSPGPPESSGIYYSDDKPFIYCKTCKWALESNSPDQISQ